MSKIHPLLFAVILIFSSCNKISNKSIMKELTIDELSKEIKNNEKFAEFYSELRETVKDLNDIEKATFYDITYRRLYDYITYENDTAYWNSILKDTHKKWKKENSSYFTKADSIINYWNDKLIRDNLQQFVEVKFDSIYWSEPSKYSRKRYGYFFFTATPLKGKLDEFELYFRFTPKDEAITRRSTKYELNIDDFFSYNDSLPEMSSLVSFDSLDESLFEKHTTKTLMEAYELDMLITYVKKDGETFGLNKKDTPKGVIECVEELQNSSSYYDYLAESVIAEFAGDKFVSSFTYTSEKLDAMKKKKDKLCFEFYENHFYHYW